MRSRILVAVLAVACGDDTSATSSTEDTSATTTDSASATNPTTTQPSTSVTSTSATSETSASESTTDAPSTSSTATTEVDSSSDTTIDPSTSSDTSSSASTGNAVAEYSAVAIIGGLNRLRIRKRNDADDLCTYVSLVDPGFGDFGSVDVTEPWGVEYGGIVGNADACELDNPAMAGGENALDATGSITLGDIGMSFVPCSVDIDVELSFIGAGGLPEIDTMTATDIAVEGC